MGREGVESVPHPGLGKALGYRRGRSNRPQAIRDYMQKILVKEIPFSEMLVGELGFEMEGIEVVVDGDTQTVRVYANSHCSLLLLD